MNGNLSIAQFGDYFRELHGHGPFLWQERLADLVISSDWPTVIDLPTASGKTACIDIAIFALACRERAARRIFFVVDRKVIVDESYARMVRIRERLCHASEGVAGEVASRLRRLAGGGGANPLEVYQLRGGIYRDESWVRSPLQPTVVASTVDQVGSRILFRGYGVSPSSQPVHAGLIANDSLILLDEAHCSKAFAQTLERIQRYRPLHRCANGHATAFRFVEMTATPSRSITEDPLRLEEEDRLHPVMRERLSGKKRTHFFSSKAKANDPEKIAADLVRQAKLLTGKEGVRRVAIMVNRVATAKAAYRALDAARKVLVIGRMRPFDRAQVEKELAPLHSGIARSESDSTVFVVSTQCLEVGADLDFDALVTECASMDALLQRFGRLNRLGKLPDGGHACIVGTVPDAKKPDPVYGEALGKTREWLEGYFAKHVELDFGLESDEATIPMLWSRLLAEVKTTMIPPAPPCPALLPSHLDTLVQTEPRPVPEPAVSYFLHGVEPTKADVGVVWRADLAIERPWFWEEIVALAPPVITEALPVSLWTFRSWMEARDGGVQSDLEGPGEEEPARRSKLEKYAPVLIWRGDCRLVTSDPEEIRPGDTIVIPQAYGGGEELGYLPGDPQAPWDVGDQAWMAVRKVARLRLHASLMAQWPDHQSKRTLLASVAGESELDWDELKLHLSGYLAAVSEKDSAAFARNAIEAVLNGKRRQFDVNYYPEAAGAGLIIQSKRFAPGSLEEDGGADEKSAGEPVTLEEHTRHVSELAKSYAEALLGSEEAAVFTEAAEWHDAGKCDPRFQVLLHGGDHFAAQLSPRTLAKGRFAPRSRRAENWRLSELPKGFRHELVSLQLAGNGAGVEGERDLLLHLIASHHGYCRPFPPVVLDAQPEEMCYGDTVLTREERTRTMAHRLDSGIADRFWRLNREHGWWGLAYLEAILRLADWNASAAEQISKLKDKE